MQQLTGPGTPDPFRSVSADGTAANPRPRHVSLLARLGSALGRAAWRPGRDGASTRLLFPVLETQKRTPRSWARLAQLPLLGSYSRVGRT